MSICSRKTASGSGQRATGQAPLRIRDPFQQNPFLTADQLVQQTGFSAFTVNAALADLERFCVVEEITGRKRGRVFSYRRYLAILSEGTDPLPTTA